MFDHAHRQLFFFLITSIYLPILGYQHSISAFITLDQHLNNGIPSLSCFLVDGMQRVLPGQASCRVNGLVVTLSKESPSRDHTAYLPAGL